MTFEDLKELGDEEAVKKAGKLRQQGKKYVVQDADVIFFKVRGDEGAAAVRRCRFCLCGSRTAVVWSSGTKSSSGFARTHVDTYLNVKRHA